MASAGPSVSVKTNANGDYIIGATISGVFVPFAQKNAGYVANVVAKGKASKPSSSSDEETE